MFNSVSDFLFRGFRHSIMSLVKVGEIDLIMCERLTELVVLSSRNSKNLVLYSRLARWVAEKVMESFELTVCLLSVCLFR